MGICGPAARNGRSFAFRSRRDVSVPLWRGQRGLRGNE